LVDKTLARLLVVAGEVQARTELCREFPPRCQEIAAETEAGRRAEGWDKEALDREVGRLVSGRADAEVAADIEAHRDRKLSTEGLESSAGALREANSDALLVSESMAGATTVWTGPEPFLIAPRERDLRDLGMSGITAVRADEALPFAAISVGADVLVVGERLADGVGVLTRHR
jgi:hypothetical protein